MDGTDVTEIVNVISDKMNEVFTSETAAQMTSAMLTVGQMAALSQLLTGVMLMVFAVASILVGRRMVKTYYVEKEAKDEYLTEADIFLAFCGYTLLYGIAPILSIIGAVQIIDPIAWASLWYPEVWIANEILDAMTTSSNTK